MTAILHKYNASTGVTPASGEIVPRELAINTADGKLFTKRDDGTVVEIGASGGGGFSAEIPWVVPASTEYIAAAPVGVTATTLAMTANRMYLMPFIPAFDFSCSALGVSVTTSVSSSLARVCVYGSGANGRPTGSALASTVDLNCASTGTKEDTTHPYAFTAGTQYWIGVHSSSTQTLRAYTAATAWSLLVVPTTTAAVVGFYQSSTFASGAPSIGTLTSNTGSSPFAYMKGT